jgi:hypothetical protein
MRWSFEAHLHAIFQLLGVSPVFFDAGVQLP